MEISNLNILRGESEVSCTRFINALYNTLRIERPYYKAENYKWKIGVYVFHDILSIYGRQGFNFNETQTLFGINVEVDRKNPYNLQLFEDITNKLGIEYESEEGQ